jgi:phosphopantothenoylcysteine synthetase/decarboxylase
MAGGRYDMSRILLGVTGGIAAYKAAELASGLIKDGFVIDVVMTRNAREFVTPLTFQTIVKGPVYTDSFAPIEDYSVEHVSLAKRADAVVVCPATANLIGKAAAGIADDLLTTVLLAVHDKPRVLCPAMNTAMWENPAVKRNLETLKDFGWNIVEPEAGRLACGDEGRGRLAEPELIADFLKKLLN